MNLNFCVNFSASALNYSEQVLRSSLFGPSAEFMSRPRKDFRAALVRVGFDLFNKDHFITFQQESSLDSLAQILEWIHAGSLVVDDIQDDSEERRGRLSLHKIHGVPVALNIGNWMYFEALTRLHQLSLCDSVKLKIIKVTHEVMQTAHRGQAIDLGVNMMHADVSAIPELVHKSHTMKSGALVALALQVGALVADNEADLEKLCELGVGLGASLQRFDDIGNLRMQSADKKSLEDLRLGRPSWVWHCLTMGSEGYELDEFRAAILRLPDQFAMKEFLRRTGLKEKSFAEALRIHRDLERKFYEAFPDASNVFPLSQLKEISEKIVYAYK